MTINHRRTSFRAVSHDHGGGVPLCRATEIVSEILHSGSLQLSGSSCVVRSLCRRLLFKLVNGRTGHFVGACVILTYLLTLMGMYERE